MEVLKCKTKKDPSKVGLSSPDVEGQGTTTTKQDRLKLLLLEKNKNDIELKKGASKGHLLFNLINLRLIHFRDCDLLL